MSPLTLSLESTATASDAAKIMETRNLEAVVVIENKKHYQIVKDALSQINNCQVMSGTESINEIAKIKCDILFSAIVGSAGVLPTLNAIKAGSNIAIANKESLVVAGDIIMEEVKKSKINLLPIDSEHNAIFQIFEQDNLNNIEKITITASGGPFFRNQKDPENITIEEALKHPNWQMGAKISIDCATMMNKGLGMIEAYRLFPVAKSQLKIKTTEEISKATGGFGIPGFKWPL